MSELPLVSIIIPCYNQAHFIGDALRSALAQSYPAIEVIVVNDGSPDDLDAVMQRYRGDARVRYLVQENRGLPAARNRGIREARGEFLKFLDADDWLLPEAIAKQVQAFLADPSLGLVYCDFLRVDAEGSILEEAPVARARRVLNGDILPSLLLGGYFTPNTVLIPRRVIEHVGGFDETLTSCEDLELWLRVVAEGYRAAFVPETLVAYRVHTANMSHNEAHMQATHLLTLETITARYPRRVAGAIHELVWEHIRVDRDSEWARGQLAEREARIAALERALQTRPVRAARALERLAARLTMLVPPRVPRGQSK